MPPVTVEGPGIAAQSLPTLLAQGGGVTLVDFVYTRCQTVCLSLGGSFQQLQTALQADRAAGTQSNVRLLSISLDGAYDTPTVLQAYAHKLQADLALWQWVRVPDGAQQKALLQRLGVVVVPDGRGDFEHNAALLVLDAQGRLVRIFDLAEQQLALDYARHLAKGGRL
jgi:protein SCO1/2